MIPVALLAPGFVHDTPRREATRFKSKAPPGTAGQKQLDVRATLYTPRGRRSPVAVVVIMPSSGGVEDAREIYYAEEFARQGFAALVVDSFGSRHVQESLYDQSPFTEWDMELDAYGALEKLAKDNRFDHDRIAIMGVSKGGTVAMNTALTVRRTWAGMVQVRFAAHIAISPDCGWLTRNPGNTGAPVLFLLAELDDQTLPAPCLRQADRMRNAGNANIEAKVYQGAHHAWEELGRKPVYDRKVENYTKCNVWTEDNGEMVSATTGELVPEEDWHDWAKRHCMTLGATCCGGTVALRSSATSDIIAFLRKFKL
jgi:dienelactone hydrolase